MWMLDNAATDGFYTLVPHSLQHAYLRSNIGSLAWLPPKIKQLVTLSVAADQTA